MFTGIIETTGEITALINRDNNLEITVSSVISKELSIDQSVSHNGICLTVVKCTDNSHTVTAIAETLRKTNLGFLNVGDIVNLERSMPANGRLDGHIVQGHVDQIAKCIDKVDEGGSWVFTFEYDLQNDNLTVEKGSICVNGTSLTVVNSQMNQFSVAIIPYTYTYTNFHKLSVGDYVNIEFDIIGKYVARLLQLRG